MYIFLGHSQCKLLEIAYSGTYYKYSWYGNFFSGLREVADSKLNSEAGYFYVTLCVGMASSPDSFGMKHDKVWWCMVEILKIQLGSVWLSWWNFLFQCAYKYKHSYLSAVMYSSLL